MRHHGRTLLRLVWFAFLTVGAMAQAQPAISRDTAAGEPEFEEGETLAQYLARYGEYPAAKPAAGASLAGRVSDGAERTTRAIPQAADAGSDAAQRDSLAAFASPLQLGFDSIEAGDSEGSFVVKWNEQRLPVGPLGISATVRQASASEEILREVTETSRKALEGAMNNRLSDLDDLTFGLRWGWERAPREGKRGWGRRFDIYEDYLESAVVDILGDNQGSLVSPEVAKKYGDCEVQFARYAEQAGTSVESWRGVDRGTLIAALDTEYEPCLEAARARERAIVALDRELAPLHLLGFLIDNQPQLVLTLLLHERDELAGRDGWEFAVSYEMGLCNLNSLLARRGRGGCGDDKDGLTIEELRDLDQTTSGLSVAAQAGNKLTFALGYAERDESVIARVFGSGEDALPVTVSLPDATEKNGKLLYSRNATWHPMKVDGIEVFPKLHVSAEYTDVSDDPKRQDRLVGQVTYEIPLTTGATLPLSLSYANHAEFLGEVDDELSAHIGLSYAIKPKEKKKGDD